MTLELFLLLVLTGLAGATGPATQASSLAQRTREIEERRVAVVQMLLRGELDAAADAVASFGSRAGIPAWYAAEIADLVDAVAAIEELPADSRAALFEAARTVAIEPGSDPVQARPASEQALQLFAEVFGAGHALTLELRIGLLRAEAASGNWLAAVEVAERGLLVAEANADARPARRAQMHGWLGRCAHRVGQWSRADAETRTALELWSGLGARELGVFVEARLQDVLGRGQVLVSLGRRAEAEELFAACASDASRELGDSHQMVNFAASNLAFAKYEQAEYAQAIALQERVVAVAIEHDAGLGLGQCLFNLGFMYRDAKRFAEARDVQEQALEIFAASAAHREMPTLARTELALLASNEGDHENGPRPGHRGPPGGRRDAGRAAERPRQDPAPTERRFPASRRSRSDVRAARPVQADPVG